MSSLLAIRRSHRRLWRRTGHRGHRTRCRSEQRRRDHRSQRRRQVDTDQVDLCADPHRIGGTIAFAGRDITGLADIDSSFPLGISAVPQSRNVFTSLTVAENLDIGTYAAPPRDRRQAEERVLAPLSRSARQARPAGGRIVRRPAPDGGDGSRLDERTRSSCCSMSRPPACRLPISKRIFDLILDIRSAGVTVLMVEQNARQALRIADRGHVLVNGRNFMSASGRRACLPTTTVRRSFLGAETVGMIEFVNFYLIPALTLGCDLCAGCGRHLDDLRHPALCPFRPWRPDDAWCLWHVDRRLADPSAAAAAAFPSAWRLAIAASLAGRPLLLPAIAQAADHLHGDLLLRRRTDLPLAGAIAVGRREPGLSSRVSSRPMVLFDTLRVSPRSISRPSCIIIAIAVALHLFLTRSRTGPRHARRLGRAGTCRGGGSRYREGHPLDLDHSAPRMAAIAGTFAGLDTDVHPNLGWNLLLAMFAAAFWAASASRWGRLPAAWSSASPRNSRPITGSAMGR